MDGWNEVRVRVLLLVVLVACCVDDTFGKWLLYQNAWLLDLAKFLVQFWSQEHYQEVIGYEVLTT